MISRRLVLVASITLLHACTTLQTQNLQPDGLKAYRRAYVETPLEDEFQVVPAMIAELSDMGFEIVGRPFAEPTDSDLLVKVTPIGGWDVTRYLQSVQIQFIAAKSGRLVISSSFYSKGLWLGVRDGRLKTLFNDIRQKNGYPPSKQFP
jgi:hypothetical protein